MHTNSAPLFVGAEWDFALLERLLKECESIAVGELGYNLHPNQLEVVTAEQMLDAYASIGMPIGYRHWSFGKRFVQTEARYRKGLQGLALEMIINSNPAVSYLMEENSATAQTLVIAHAACGHNHFFKNNYVFKEWTDPGGIIEYMAYAKRFVAYCEERYGYDEVEQLLDAAHALWGQGIDRAKRPRPLNLQDEERLREERIRESERLYNDLWAATVPKRHTTAEDTERKERLGRLRLLGGGEENLLYFIEKFAPKLRPWQREIVRIVRKTAQYFYPQMLTKVLNEGCASYSHYVIMNRLHQKGLVTDGAMQEFVHLHSSVIFQPDFDDQRFGGINPYALGFAVSNDIVRIADGIDEWGRPLDVEQRAEDREWFPDIAGKGGGLELLRDAWANFRDESVLRQYLSPKVMRDFKLFSLTDDADEPELEVGPIHDDEGYRELRKRIADSYDVSAAALPLYVTDVDLFGDRTLKLKYEVRDGRSLDEDSVAGVMPHIAYLWGYPVDLAEVDEDGTELVKHEFDPDYD